MRTKTELSNALAARYADKLFSKSTFAELVSAVQASTSRQKSQLVENLVNGNVEKAGDLLRNALLAEANKNAAMVIDGMLANDTLSLEEIDAIL